MTDMAPPNSPDGSSAAPRLQWERMIERFDQIRAELSEWTLDAERCEVSDVADLIQTAKGNLAMAEDLVEAHYGRL